MAVSALRAWTIEDLDRLPDDGNTYEVVRGELFVTPAPARRHQRVITRLAAVLHPYVAAENLGFVHQARSVVQRKGSQTEPDLYVSEDDGGSDWETAPRPSLIVEVFSPTTWRRDVNQKRAYYLEDVGVPEYWMIDPRGRLIRVSRSGAEDLIVNTKLIWHPAGAARPLEIDVSSLLA